MSVAIDEKYKPTSTTAKVYVTSLNLHIFTIYSDTKYGFLSMRTKRNPHCSYASGDTRKEELTKRLCSLVDNSQDSRKKVPSAKKCPTDYAQPIGIWREKRERREREGHEAGSSWQKAAGRDLQKLDELRRVE